MNTLSTALRENQTFTTQRAPVGLERDRLWWINDAARMVRNEEWGALDPEHIRNLIEEIRDLQWMLDRDRVLDPPDSL